MSGKRAAPAASVALAAIGDGTILMEKEESRFFCRLQPAVAGGTWAGLVQGPEEWHRMPALQFSFLSNKFEFLFNMSNYFQQN